MKAQSYVRSHREDKLALVKESAKELAYSAKNYVREYPENKRVRCLVFYKKALCLGCPWC